MQIKRLFRRRSILLPCAGLASLNPVSAAADPVLDSRVAIPSFVMEKDQQLSKDSPLPSRVGNTEASHLQDEGRSASASRERQELGIEDWLLSSSGVIQKSLF